MTIGAREIYDQVVGMRSTMDRLVDQGMDAEQVSKDHEVRLRALERGRWPLPALSAVIAVVAIVVTVWQAISAHH